jgi:fructose-1,6-bisphosphatase II
MERELALEFARVTEAAALAASRWVGLGDKNEADGAAVAAMRVMFDSVAIAGVVVIGEGELDEAPMLYIGEKVGNAAAPAVDIAVDPVEGTTNVANGLTNAIAVLASAPRGTLLHAPDMYMDKIAVGPACKGAVYLDNPVEENIRAVAARLNKSISEVTVVILNRPRHEEIISRIRTMGSRIKLIGDGDVSPCVATAYPNSGVDILLGIGGAPEGVISAAAMKCLGGDFQARLVPDGPEEIERCHRMGISDVNKLFTIDELVSTDDVLFSATGITDSFMLTGVRYQDGKAITQTLVMRSRSGTIRFIEATHDLAKKTILHDPRVMFR